MPRIDETAICRHCGRIIVFRPLLKIQATAPLWWHVISMNPACESGTGSAEPKE